MKSQPSKSIDAELSPTAIAMNLYARMSDCGNPDCIDRSMCFHCTQSLGLLGDYVTNLLTTQLNGLLAESREYEITDLEMMEHHSETPLVAVPVEAIKRHREAL